MLLEEVDLELAGEAVVTDRCYDLNLRRENLEHDIETYLIVSSSGAAMCYSISSKSLYVVENFKCLEYTL